MTTYEYKLVCDYDGTVDWDGAGREVTLYPKSISVSEFDASGTTYRRAIMPWNTSKTVGTREYRQKNQRLTINTRVADEDAARLLESWGLMFPELWEPSRGFDALKYYDDSDVEYDDMEGAYERPNNTPKTLFDDIDDYLYIGSKTAQFTAIDVYMDVLGVGGTLVWQYWDGDSWETLTVTNGGFTANAKMSWTAPGDWAKYIISAIHPDPMYYVRCSASGSPSPDPQVMFIKRHRPISCYLMQSADGGATWDFWYRPYYSTRYYPNSFSMKNVDRVLSTGSPTLYLLNITLVEANY